MKYAVCWRNVEMKPDGEFFESKEEVEEFRKSLSRLEELGEASGVRLYTLTEITEEGMAAI